MDNILGIFRRKVGARIILGYVLILSLMISLNLVTLALLDQFSATVNDLTNNLEVEKRLSEDVSARIWQTRFYANRYIHTQQPFDREQFNNQYEQLEASLQKVSEQIENPERRQILASIQADATAYGQAFTKITEIIDRQKKTQKEVLDVQLAIIDTELNALRARIDATNNPLASLVLSNAQTAIQSMEKHALSYLADGDGRYIGLLEKNYLDAQEALTSLTNTEGENPFLSSPVQRQDAEDAQAALEAYHQGFQTIRTDYAHMRILSIDTLDMLGPTISSASAQIADSVRKEFNTRNAENQEMANRTRWILLLSTVGVSILSLGLGFMLSRRITTPLQQVMQVSQQIADVDLQALTNQMNVLSQGDVRLNLSVSAQPLQINLEDEVGQTAQACNQIVFRMHEAETAFRAMSAYLNEMTTAAQSIGNNNLDVQVAVRSENDALGNAIAEMLNDLRTAQVQMQRQMNRLSILRRVDRLITSSPDLNSTLQYLLDQAIFSMEIEAGEVILLDLRAQTMMPIARAGSLPEITQTTPVPMAGCYVEQVALQRQALYLDDLASAHPGCQLPVDAAHPSGAVHPASATSFRSCYALPIIAMGHIEGVLAVFHREALTPDAEWRGFLESLAGQAAIAIDNAELVHGLEERVALRTAELEASRSFFESLFTNSPVAIVVMGLDDKILSWNPQAEKLFQYTQAEVLGQNIDELVTTPEIYAEAAVLSMQAADGSMIHAFTRRKRKDGALVDVEVLAVPVMAENRKSGSIAIYHDITELQKARQAAEEATQAKSEFLANMSHEIRTPMNGVIGMTSLLLDMPLTPEQHEYAETIRKSGDALLSIVNDILDFSKIEAGKLELEMHPFDLRECVESAVDLVTYQAGEKQLELLYNVEPDAPESILGDATRLRQVLVNLLNNAIKFTEQGEVGVTVEIVKDKEIEDNETPLPDSSSPAPCTLHFMVHDTGVGIPPERASRLFLAFSQIDASTTRKYGGTGLGLAICKRLVEFMGGEIWVESEGVFGKGSTFHFTIYATPVEFHRPSRHNNILPDLKDARVLVIDDNATNRLIVSRMVQAWGMQPVLCASGNEALAKLDSGATFDLVLLDVQMPEMDGITLLAEIRKRYPEAEMPVIILSSLGQKEDFPEDLRVTAYLNKPIKPSQLYDALAPVFSEDVSQIQAPITELGFDTRMGERHPLRILLAEDNLVNQKVVRLILERLGYRTDVVANGLEVLSAFRRQDYDVVLMDIHMPEMNGIEATRRLRADLPRQRQPRIVALTANALGGERDEYLAEGLDDYLSKPVHVQQLRAALEKCMPLNLKTPPASAAAVVETPAAEQPIPEQIITPPEAPAPSPDELPAIDLPTLKEYFPYEGEDALVMASLAEEYLADTRGRLQDMKAMLARADPQAAGKQAHSIKSASLTFGARRLSVLCKEVETMGKSGQLEGMPEKMAEMLSEFQRVQIELQKIIEEIQT